MADAVRTGAQTPPRIRGRGKIFTGYNKEQARRIIRALPRLREGIVEQRVIENITAHARAAVLRNMGLWKGQRLNLGVRHTALSAVGQKDAASIAAALKIVEAGLTRAAHMAQEEVAGFVLRICIEQGRTPSDILGPLRELRGDLEREALRPVKHGRRKNEALEAFGCYLAWAYFDASGLRPTRRHNGEHGEDYGPFLRFVEAAVGPPRLLPSGIKAHELVRRAVALFDADEQSRMGQIDTHAVS
jgi:hypothetical protein